MALQGPTYNEDYEEPKKSPKRDSLTSDLLLVAALAVVLVFLLVPSLRTRIMGMFTVETQQKIATEVTVWANKNAGYYYCSGSRFYGHNPGSYMKQGDALTLGYQPEFGKYCTESQTDDAKAVNPGKVGASRAEAATQASEEGRAATQHAR